MLISFDEKSVLDLCWIVYSKVKFIGFSGRWYCRADRMSGTVE